MPLAISVPQDWGPFVKYVKSMRSAPRLFLGAPVDLTKTTNRSSKETYRLVSPVFVHQVEHWLENGVLRFQAVGPVEVNHGWLENRFKRADDRQTFLDVCGIELADRPDDDSGKADGTWRVGLREAFDAFSHYYHDRWKEHADLERPQCEPLLRKAKVSGIYNRVILATQPGLKYAGGLHNELLRLSSEVPDADLDRSALRLLFPHTPPGGSAKPDDVPSDVDDTDTATDVGGDGLAGAVELETLNPEQRSSVRLAATEPMSVITGPPGTGKSRVVAHAMANAAVGNRSAILASRNHQAIEAVEPRLNALTEPDLLVLRLTRPFGEAAPDPLPSAVLNLFSKPKPVGVLEEIEENRVQLGELVSRRNEVQSHLDELFTAFERLEELQFSVTERLWKTPREIAAKAWDVPSQVPPHRIQATLNRLRYSQSKGNLLRRVLGSIIWLIKRKAILEDAASIIGEFERVFGLEPTGAAAGQVSPSRLIEVLDGWLPVAHAQAEVQEIRELRKKLDALPTLHDSYERHRRLVERILRVGRSLVRLTAAALGARLSGDERQEFAEIWAGLQNHPGGTTNARFDSALRNAFPRLVRHLPLWATTNLSARRRLPLVSGAFDLLIIDEASQCDIASVLPLLFRCRRVVVVGDPMQLPHVSSLSRDVDRRIRQKLDLMDTRFERFTYRVNSFFQLAVTNSSLEARAELKEHHRSHPSIAEYCNEAFYGKTLRVATDRDGLRFPGTRRRTRSGIQWTEVPADASPAPGGRGAISLSQVEAILDELRRLSSEGFGGTVGVVTPFRTQANRIRDRASEELTSLPPDWRFIVDTADGFQGDERDVILLSLVGGPDMPKGALWFLKESPNRFNVAVSRARAALHVFGDGKWAQNCSIGHISKLWEASKRQEGERGSPVRKDLIGPVWEPKLAEAMQEAELPFQQQYQACGYYLDFALIRDGLKLDVEVDGEQFHRDSTGRRKVEDLQRDMVLVAGGWKIKRFWVYELRESIEICVEEVRQLWHPDGETSHSESWQ